MENGRTTCDKERYKSFVDKLETGEAGKHVLVQIQTSCGKCLVSVDCDTFGINKVQEKQPEKFG